MTDAADFPAYYQEPTKEERLKADNERLRAALTAVRDDLKEWYATDGYRDEETREVLAMADGLLGVTADQPPVSHSGQTAPDLPRTDDKS